jgi:hypothetical protein
MRSIVALGILLLGVSGAEPEPEYSLLDDGSIHLTRESELPSLIEIETSTARSDRLAVAMLQSESLQSKSLQPKALAVEIFRPGTLDPTSPLANADSTSDQTVEVSLDDRCNALFTSAEANDLPVPFFANLLWQESGLQDNIVSSKGALGIAQFMPETAAESGLDNPFDPLKAIPASAHLLNELRLEFGNLGFVAAAYNAGPGRVIAWLEHRQSLPRETRDYVVQVTGRSVDVWRTTPPDNATLKFVRPLPCRNLPAFASLEQAQLEEAQSEPPEPQPAHKPEPPAAAHDTHEHDTHEHDTHERGAHDHVAERKHVRPHGRHDEARATRDSRADSHAGRHEVAHAPHGAREKHRSA